jgi:hypothetical protein
MVPLYMKVGKGNISPFKMTKVGGAINGESVSKYCMYLTGYLEVFLIQCSPQILNLVLDGPRARTA